MAHPDERVRGEAEASLRNLNLVAEAEAQRRAMDLGAAAPVPPAP